MNRLAMLLCLAVAACGLSDRSLSYRSPANTPLGECERQADKDPKVQALLLQNFDLVADPPHDQALRRARIEATNACLRAKGLPVPGGVQPVNTSGYVL
jgi:hypothetical protein